MDDRLARYLRQQADLGGAEVVLSRPPIPDGPPLARPEGGAPSGAAPGTGKQRPATRPSSEVPAGEPAPVASLPTATSTVTADPSPGKWRVDAPPIPGAGLVVELPEHTLLADAVAGADSLDALAALIRGCEKCRLCQGRVSTVPGEGNPRATLMCVGEGPGAKEDETGRPFVGAAGQLLDQILAAIDCPRESVFIANIVKCRPPQNRKPLPDEATSCLPFLHRQIALIRPRVLLALGGTAAEWLLGVKQPLGALRGKVHRLGGVPLVVTYHPAALLRNPGWKRPTWDDVRIARQLLEG